MTEKPYTEEQIHQALVASNGGRRLRRLLDAGRTAALLATTAAVVILTLVVADRDHDARDAVGVADCRSLFDNRVADAREEKFDAAMAIIKEEGRVIIETAAVHPPAPFDPAPIFKAIAASDKATADYDATVKARDDWTAGGSPLPCPIKAG